MVQAPGAACDRHFAANGRSARHNSASVDNQRFVEHCIECFASL
jgi:hypothetical protein